MRGNILSYNPLTEVVNELKGKMKALLPQLNTQIAIIDDLADLKYIDPELEEERAEYIKDYVETNFSLIEINQYSIPLSGVLLGFFKISKKVMLVLYSATGKSGTLLAYRGVLNAFTAKIDEALDKLQEIYELESIAYEIIRLKKVKAVEATPALAFDTSIPTTTTVPLETLSPTEVYPKLDPKYAKKKFAFKEGLCLQYADGKNNLEDISEKCNFSLGEIREIVDKYEKKGWLEIIQKK